jgi:hypothetical protein
MLGWSIFISRLTRGNQTPATADSEPGESLASWTAGGLSGLDWIDTLVKSNNAIDLGGNGYPIKYTALAHHILPLVVSNWPEATSTTDNSAQHMAFGRSTPKIDQEAVGHCTHDEWLLVEAWDES